MGVDRQRDCGRSILHALRGSGSQKQRGSTRAFIPKLLCTRDQGQEEQLNRLVWVGREIGK